MDDPPNIPPAATAAAATSNMENVADSETDEEDVAGSETDDDEEYTADITAHIMNMDLCGQISPTTMIVHLKMRNQCRICLITGRQMEGKDAN